MQAIEREILQQDWTTLIFILMILLLVLMKLHRVNLLIGYSLSFFTQGFFEKRAEKDPPFYSIFHGTIFLFSSLCYSLIISFLINHKTFYEFSVIFIIVFIYLFTKNSFDFFLEKLFITKKKTIYFRFTKIGYLYTCALWLFPVLIFYHYGLQNFYLLIIPLCFLGIIRLFLVFNNNKKLIFNQFFYFILYICSLEITPLLILYKITTT